MHRSLLTKAVVDDLIGRRSVHPSCEPQILVAPVGVFLCELEQTDAQSEVIRLA